MNDLISRRAAIKAIDDLPNCYNGYSDTYDKAYIIGVLEELPTIDVPDRKFGEWMAEPNCWYRCSNCGQHYPSIRGYMDYKYCPNCGARMERSGVSDE